MKKITHPIEPEELMAYLDGELSADRSETTREHLSACQDCQILVSELRAVSRGLSKWEVDSTNPNLPAAIAGSLEEYGSKSLKATNTKPDRWWHVLRKWDLGWIGAVAALFLIAIGTIRLIGGNANNVFSTVSPEQTSQSTQTRVVVPHPGSNVTPPSHPSDQGVMAGLRGDMPKSGSTLSENFRMYLSPPQEARHQGLANAPTGGGGGGGSKEPHVTGPMIVRSAELGVISKAFDQARGAIETITRQRRGYISLLTVGGTAGSGRKLTATLRVPADQLDATLAELKALGRVESESQNGQDVTSQYVDLQARLTNSRTTEQRLTQMLQQRTGKLSDVLEVEQEVDRVRGEIEQMEAERKTMSNQVAFATINTAITEDYKAELQVVPPSTATRLRNAAVEGYRSMVDGAVSLALFLLADGPSFLLWGALLFFPSRFVWKKVWAAVHATR